MKIGRFVPNQARVLAGGLEGVEEGLQMMKNEQVSAETLVLKIKDEV